jgi:hypothetical protein
MPQSLKYIGTVEPFFETPVTGRATSWRRGQIQEASSDVAAAQLLATGLFQWSQAEVSHFAPVLSSQLAILQGAIGESRQIADGPDAGARVVWSVPQGATAPTWCWWLWPQSAYEGS